MLTPGNHSDTALQGGDRLLFGTKSASKRRVLRVSNLKARLAQNANVRRFGLMQKRFGRNEHGRHGGSLGFWILDFRISIGFRTWRLHYEHAFLASAHQSKDGRIALTIPVA